MNLRYHAVVIHNFITIIHDTIVVEHKKWLEIRDPEKIEYRNMCSEID